MDSLGTGPTSALDSTFGAILIGLLFSAFFQGLLTVHTYNYFENFPEDKLLIKITVALVWFLDTIHLALIGQSTYHYLITNWGYQPALALSTWELSVQLVFIGFTTFICQIFFLNRIWVFSKRNIFIVGFILAVCLSTLSLHILVILQILLTPLVAEFGAKRAEIIAVFTLGASADILIAGSMCYYLQRDRPRFLESTKSLVGRVLRYTIATGLATSALSIGSLITYFAQPHGFYFMAAHFCLGRMYSYALLITLNGRQKLRMMSFQVHTRQKSGVSVERLETSIRFTRHDSPFQSQEDGSIDGSVDRIDRGEAFGSVEGKAPLSVL